MQAQQLIDNGIIGALPRAALQHGREQVCRNQQDKQQGGHAPPARQIQLGQRNSEPVPHHQYQGDSQDDQQGADQRPAIKVQPEKGGTIAGIAGQNMQQHLSGADHGGGQGADNHDAVVGSFCAKLQVEHKAETGDDQADPLQ